MALVVAGIDPSLTSTGVACVFDVTGDEGPEIAIGCSTYGRKGKRNESIASRGDRLRALADEILMLVWDAQLVVIEGPSTHSVGGSTHDRSGLWWLTVDQLVQRGVPVAVVPPAVRAKWACGSGAGKKDVVMKAMRAQFPDVMLEDDNQADALALAAMGMAHLGRPLHRVNMKQREALGTSLWPTGDTVALMA